MHPLEAIRKNCLSCCLGQHKEVDLCEAFSCPSHSLRRGKRVEGISPLQVIKEHCRACGDEHPEDCQVTECCLWPFRLGKNPNRAGIGRFKQSPTEAPNIEPTLKSNTKGRAGGCSSKISGVSWENGQKNVLCCKQKRGSE